MTYTPYRNLTTKELLVEFENKKGNSPIIDELLFRLETSVLTCPVCLSDLTRKERDGRF